MKRLACLFALLLLAGCVLLGRRVYVLWYHPESLQLTVALPNTARVMRAIYPFSVVPGGVNDSQDLAESMAHDPVARRHYEGIQPDRLWPMRAPSNMLAYVSYRKGNSVYWTDHQVKIAEGELLLTDGTNLVRGRCGNRVSFKRPTPLPKSAVPPEGPPPDIVFETPLPGISPPVITSPPPPEIAVQHGSPSPPFSPPPTVCCGSSPPPAVVPEPSTFVLLGSGLLTAVGFFRKYRR